MSEKRSAGAAGAERPRRAVLALDYGKARVGVAVSDELCMLAHPRPNLDAKSLKPLLAAIVDLAREENVRRILLGLPFEMTGAAGPSTARVLKLATAVADATGIEVELVDERLTTSEAERRLREAGRTRKESRSLIDGASASVLLQAWLDRTPSVGSPSDDEEDDPGQS